MESRSIALCLFLVACGSKEESKTRADPPNTPTKAPANDRFAKVKQPKVSPVCEKARETFGYGAECVETALPELTTAAGTLTRVVRKGDPTGQWMYVLTRPDGTLFLGTGSSTGWIVGEVVKTLDARTLAPDLLAKLHAGLHVEVAIVRCLPGANDVLPAGKGGKKLECSAPAVEKRGDKQMLTYIVERFAHPRLQRTDHWIYTQEVEVKEHELSFLEGEGLAELPVDIAPPKDQPQLPAMTTPPAWVAEPVAAAADLSAALCLAASKPHFELVGRNCKAFGYPALDLPTGKLFYLANDIGRRHMLALQKPDGAIVVGYDLETKENPLVPIIKSYDPATVPPAKLVAAHLFLHGEPARILCLPGSNDVIPDTKCEPPAVTKTPDGLAIKAIVEELPFPDGNGSVSDPAVRSFAIDLSPGGGSLGGGFRLVDMREDR